MEKTDSIDISFLNEYILDNLYSCKTTSKSVQNAKYHHNTNYSVAPSVLKNGLLSFKKRLELEKNSMTDKDRNFYLDDMHINGTDSISLSTMDMDFSKKYWDEFVFDYDSPFKVDFVVSSDVKTYRITSNYYNEFLAQDRIDVKDIRSIDIRLLKLIKESPDFYFIVNNYNLLKVIAKELINNKQNILFRDMSDENITLDPKKILKLNNLKIK